MTSGESSVVLTEPMTVPSSGPRLALVRLPLLAGLYGGLTLLVAEIPASVAFTEQHGPLMALGFLGTVISLERAVALRSRWAGRC